MGSLCLYKPPSKTGQTTGGGVGAEVPTCPPSLGAVSGENWSGPVVNVHL